MRSIALSLALAAAIPLAAVAAPKGVTRPAAPAVQQGPHGDPELQSLRRQLASAVLISELKLSTDQKKALKSVIAEAKKVRDEVRNDPDLAKFRVERKALLQSAIDEVHSKGTLSEATKKSLEDGRKDAPIDHDEMKEKMISLKESVKGILTAEQLEKLQEMREKRAAKLEAKGFKGFKKGGKKGEGRHMLRLLMSDEFAAELDR